MLSFSYFLPSHHPFAISFLPPSSFACFFSQVCVCGGGGYSEPRRVCVCCLIAVGMETSVISRRSLPCRPANNQHPLCACSTSRCLSSSLSPPPSPPPSPPLSHACCHNDKPHSAIVPRCSPTRTKNGGGYLPPKGGLVEIEEGKRGIAARVE